MTIEEIRANKAIVEEKINTLINDFTRDNEVNLLEVECEITNYRASGNARPRSVVNVSLVGII